jgi:hypothetical protein
VEIQLATAKSVPAKLVVVSLQRQTIARVAIPAIAIVVANHQEQPLFWERLLFFYPLFCGQI